MPEKRFTVSEGTERRSLVCPLVVRRAQNPVGLAVTASNRKLPMTPGETGSTTSLITSFVTTTPAHGDQYTSGYRRDAPRSPIACLAKNLTSSNHAPTSPESPPAAAQNAGAITAPHMPYRCRASAPVLTSLAVPRQGCAPVDVPMPHRCSLPTSLVTPEKTAHVTRNS